MVKLKKWFLNRSEKLELLPWSTSWLSSIAFGSSTLNFSNIANPLSDTVFSWNLNHPANSWVITHDYNFQPDSVYTGEAVYTVCLVVQNQHGCVDTTCKALIVHKQPLFVAPNIFTPGSDGSNQEFTFEFLSQGISSFSCTIVNRWGTQVAELNHITDGWDGNDPAGNQCPDGVYFYTYQAVSTNGTSFTGQGTVQLIRGN